MVDRHPLPCPDPRRRFRAPILLAVLCALVLLPLHWSASARADVFGPDESIGGAAGPLQPGVTYSGAFASPGDIDYLSFDVTQPGESLHFDIANTLQGCNSPDDDYCPMWGTLVDGNGQQLGGEGSTAGTGEVDWASSDAIDWTFSTPGRYYLVLESSGDLPTFQLDFHGESASAVSSSGGSGGGGGSSGGGAVGGSAGGSTDSGSGGGGSGAGSGGAGGGFGTGSAGGGGLAGGGAGVSDVGPGLPISSFVVPGLQRGLMPTGVVVTTQPLTVLDIEVFARIGRGLPLVAHVIRRHPAVGPQRIRVPMVLGRSWLARHPRGVAEIFRLTAFLPDGSGQFVERIFTLWPR